MPYVRCPSCRLTTYTPGPPYGRDSCPSCDAELPRAARPSHPTWGSDGDRAPGNLELVHRVLELAREQLGMDVAFLGEIRGDEELLHALVGRAPEFNLRPGTSLPLHDTICGALLEERVTNAVPDVTQVPECAKLRVPQMAGARAYVGVPLTAADARLYMLCCLAREARPGLGERDVQVLRGLAESMRAALDE